MSNSIICMIISIAMLFIAEFYCIDNEIKRTMLQLLWGIFLSAGFICGAIERESNK